MQRTNPKNSNEFLISELKRYCKIHNRNPTYVSFDNDKDFPSSSTCKIRFGTWNNALIAADILINKKRELLKIDNTIIIKDYLNGCSVKDICFKYNIKSQSAVFLILKKHNITLNNKKWTNEY